MESGLDKLRKKGINCQKVKFTILVNLLQSRLQHKLEKKRLLSFALFSLIVIIKITVSICFFHGLFKNLTLFA